MLVDEAGRGRRGVTLVATLIALACAFLAPPLASAENEVFMVDSVADAVDDDVGAEGCLTADDECTLRAAIEESNFSGESDEIIFAEAVFDGQADSTIVLASGLPAMVETGRVNGRECPTEAGVIGPCVGIDALSTDPGLIVEDANGTEIEGLAVTGAQTGIEIDSSESVKIRGSWFGVELDGSAGGNATGALVGPGSSEARIGGEGPGAGNVFAHSAGDGLDVLGASSVKILGNYFGVEPDGATPAANGKDVEVNSTSSGEFEASGVSIGTKVSASAAASPACDGGCNLISGSASSGIDLEGDGGQEAPAVGATIAGNYIGLDSTGSVAIPNATAGIRVGNAARTVIGGPKAGEANRINGGAVGVLAGPVAEDLVIRGNPIGVDAAGAESLAPPDEGIVVNSEGLSSPAVEATIAGNEIWMDGGVAILQRGFGARIAGNEIVGAETGIQTQEYTAEHGNLIEGNFIEETKGDGILVENDLNEIVSNEIFGAGESGISIQGPVPFGVTENRVGGDTASEENAITGSLGAAIEIVDVEATANEVARNWGAFNGGLFIDLVAAGAEPNGPNNGIEPPEISTATQVGASGSAEAGANVRVFRKQRAEAGELDSFLGEAIADVSGKWKVVYEGAIPAGTIVAATQTSEAGGTSELGMATTGGKSGGGGGAGGGGGDGTGSPGAPPPETVIDKAPQTTIVKAPKKKSKSSTARFKFASDEDGASFQCKLDRKKFKACESPKKYEGLKPGKHVFEVRAIDSGGQVDPSPAKKKFTVLER